MDMLYMLYGHALYAVWTCFICCMGMLYMLYGHALYAVWACFICCMDMLYMLYGHASSNDAVYGHDCIEGYYKFKIPLPWVAIEIQTPLSHGRITICLK